MSVFGERIKKLRGNQSIDDLVIKLNEKYQTKISKSMISRYENGQVDPKMETVRIFADYFNVSADYLAGLTDTEGKPFQPELTSKDERDIEKKLQEIINGLSGNNSYAAFDGQTLDDMDEEDRELLIASLENSLRLAKRIAKQKFTPNKHRN